MLIHAEYLNLVWTNWHKPHKVSHSQKHGIQRNYKDKTLNILSVKKVLTKVDASYIYTGPHISIRTVIDVWMHLWMKKLYFSLAVSSFMCVN